jgi:hypothetical protein
MALPVGEFARRTLLRALIRHTQVVRIVDNDASDSDENPDLVRCTEPEAVMTLRLADVGLTNQAQVELFRAELKAEMPLIDGELTMAKLSPGTKLTRLRDFLAAALDLKV